LHQRIAHRAERLFEQGVEEEVRKALPMLGPTSKQAIGIKAVEDVLSGVLSKKEAEQSITTATRQYARRQETWFKKEAALERVPPERAMEVALRLIRP
jgi:tRNA dimethylallyltransferase